LAPQAIIALAAACAVKVLPFRFTSCTASHIASVSSRNGLRGKIPALFTSTSSRPNAATVAATSAWQAGTVATLPWSSSARCPAARISAATASAAARSSSQFTATA